MIKPHASREFIRQLGAIFGQVDCDTCTIIITALGGL